MCVFIVLTKACLPVQLAKNLESCHGRLVVVQTLFRSVKACERVTDPSENQKFKL